MQLTSSGTSELTAQGFTNNYGQSTVQLRSQRLRAVVADFYFFFTCTAVPYDLAEGRIAKELLGESSKSEREAMEFVAEG